MSGPEILKAVWIMCPHTAMNSPVGLATLNSERGAVISIFFFSTPGSGFASRAIASSCAGRFGLELIFYVITLFSIVTLLLSLKVSSPQNRHFARKL